MVVKYIIVRKRRSGNYSLCVRFTNGKEKCKTIYDTDIVNYIKENRQTLVKYINTMLEKDYTIDDILNMITNKEYDTETFTLETDISKDTNDNNNYNNKNTYVFTKTINGIQITVKIKHG